MTVANELEDGVTDELATQLEGDVAEILAALSTAVDTPSDFDQTAAPFDSNDVSFNDGLWMTRLAEVQGWFHFEDYLPGDNTANFLRALARSLGFTDTSEALDSSGGIPRLTTEALDRLRVRAEAAARLQQVFLDEFESEDGTRNSATRVWVAAWEDESDLREEAPVEPVSAKADTWKIEEFIGLAKEQELNLAPSYQRGDVWRTGARQMLVESILRGIPLPSVILLMPSDAQDQQYEVVDGKQRLTSILRFVGKHPLAIERVERAHDQFPENNLRELFNTNYPKFKAAWKALFHEPLTTALEEEYYFPFKLRTDERGLAGQWLMPLRGKYYTQIKDEVIRIADNDVPVRRVFEGHSDYRIPIILYSRANQRQIHEVFNLYNKQGTHLNAEEIRNAIFHELEFTRAILVSAGDSDPRADITKIAPSLESNWSNIQPLQETLRGYGFGASRYRCTKVLSWIVASLLGESRSETLPSTAKHIDTLLQRIQNNRQDPLRNPDVIGDLFHWLAESVEIHAANTELWSSKFRDGGSGAKWQELQLVGSLLGIAIANAADPEGIERRVYEHGSEIYEASKLWKRPTKTQTRTQWEFIAKVSRDIVRLLQVEEASASAAISARFGSSGVDSLWAVIDDGDN
ncbi:GmrSD restriction endonuclease domain-containing protein [Arthrobacter sp. MMS24-T111]